MRACKNNPETFKTMYQPQPAGCWQWTACENGNGYGRLWWQGQLQLAHRVAFSIAHSRWPDHLVLHRCNNPGCVNPEHLYEGSQSENVLDQVNARTHYMLGKGGFGSPNCKVTQEKLTIIKTSEANSKILAKQLGLHYQTVRKYRRLQKRASSTPVSTSAKRRSLNRTEGKE